MICTQLCFCVGRSCQVQDDVARISRSLSLVEFDLEVLTADAASLLLIQDSMKRGDLDEMSARK